MLLPVPFFSQTSEKTCVPASLRMVAAYWGYSVSEEALCGYCGTPPGRATSFQGAIEGVIRCGLQVQVGLMALSESPIYEYLALPENSTRYPNVKQVLNHALFFQNTEEAWQTLTEVLHQNIPLIAFLTQETERLGWVRRHCVVVTGWEGERLFLNDPAQESGGGSLAKEVFLQYWRDSEFRVIVARK